MRILVLGAEGMAGHTVTAYLVSKGYSVTATARETLDIKCWSEFPRGFDYVINCIGILLADSEKDIELTFYINSFIPRLLSHYYYDIPVIHLSTDCVFDGKEGNYTEYHFPNETGVYGLSKSLGELDNDKDITIRTSIIGPEIKEPSRRSGLFDWCTRNSGKTLNGYANVYWSGITTLELAKNIEKLINSDIKGIVHPVSSRISKHALLTKINKVFDLKQDICPISYNKPIDKSLIDSKELFDIPDIETQLKELREWILTH